jgi:hypothetical protein
MENQELLLEQEVLGHHGSSTPGFNELWPAWSADAQGAAAGSPWRERLRETAINGKAPRTAPQTASITNSPCTCGLPVGLALFSVSIIRLLFHCLINSARLGEQAGQTLQRCSDEATARAGFMVGSGWWFGWFLFVAFQGVRLVSQEGGGIMESAKHPIQMALKRVLQGLKLVAGAGFEPATFRL